MTTRGSHSTGRRGRRLQARSAQASQPLRASEGLSRSAGLGSRDIGRRLLDDRPGSVAIRSKIRDPAGRLPLRPHSSRRRPEARSLFAAEWTGRGGRRQGDGPPRDPLAEISSTRPQQGEAGDSLSRLDLRSGEGVPPVPCRRRRSASPNARPPRCKAPSPRPGAATRAAPITCRRRSSRLTDSRMTSGRPGRCLRS